MPLLLIIIITLFPLLTTTYCSDMITALKHEGSIYIRSAFSDENDVVIQIGEGNNGQITFLRTGLVPKASATTVDTCRAMFVFHVTPDDSAPWKVNGTYIGAGHGWSAGVLEIEEAAHGLQESDIGSLWKDTENRAYRLIHLPDANRLWLMPENLGSLVRWNFNPHYTPPFHHVDGRSIAGSTLKRVQLLPSLRFHSKTYLVDGKTPLSEGVPITGKYLEAIDQHDIINPAAVLQTVLATPGQAISFNGPELDALLTNTITYRFEPYGQCLIRQQSTIHVDLALDYAGIIQTSPLVRREGDELWAFIPGVLPFEKRGEKFDFQSLQDYSTPPPEPLHFSVEEGNLATPENPPHRFIQLLKTRRTSEPAIGYAIGYSLTDGLTVPDQRAAHCRQSAFIHTSSKFYPIALDSKFGTLYEGSTLNFTAYRRYFAPHAFSNHATSLYWYRDNENILIYGDYHQPVAKDKISLPFEFTGAQFELLESTPGITLHTDPASKEKSINISSSASQGSFVLKLHQ